MPVAVHARITCGRLIARTKARALGSRGRTRLAGAPVQPEHPGVTAGERLVEDRGRHAAGFVTVGDALAVERVDRAAGVAHDEVASAGPRANRKAHREAASRGWAEASLGPDPPRSGGVPAEGFEHLGGVDAFPPVPRTQQANAHVDAPVPERENPPVTRHRVPLRPSGRARNRSRARRGAGSSNSRVRPCPGGTPSYAGSRATIRSGNWHRQLPPRNGQSPGRRGRPPLWPQRGHRAGTALPGSARPPQCAPTGKPRSWQRCRRQARRGPCGSPRSRRAAGPLPRRRQYDAAPEAVETQALEAMAVCSSPSPISCSWRTDRGVRPSPHVFSLGKPSSPTTLRRGRPWRASRRRMSRTARRQ